MPTLISLRIVQIPRPSHHNHSIRKLNIRHSENVFCHVLVLQRSKLPTFDLVNCVVELFAELIVLTKKRRRWGLKFYSDIPSIGSPKYEIDLTVPLDLLLSPNFAILVGLDQERCLRLSLKEIQDVRL